jgi:hypothetical protein
MGVVGTLRREAMPFRPINRRKGGDINRKEHPGYGNGINGCANVLRSKSHTGQQ